MLNSYNNCQLAAIQMVSTDNVKENLQAAERLINQVVDLGAQLILLPEFFPAILSSNIAIPDFAENFNDGVIQQWAAKLASKHKVWLCSGTIPLRVSRSNKIANSSLLFDAEGKCQARYDKIHLFRYKNANEQYDEAQMIEAGKIPQLCQTPFGRIGFSICYDLRFPELFRQLGREQPLDLILLPAAFTATTGQAHWEVLIRARAIENQCYLLAAAQGGWHNAQRQTFGHSSVINPWGEIIDCKQRGSGWAMGLLDHQYLQHIRQQLPVHSHREL